jgi:type IX secretion system PorP/SprF family membrane protein
MKQRYIFPILFVFCVNALCAQQLAQYSLWLLNPYSYNPAFAGLEPSLVANGTYRQQWVDLEGAPVTQQINAHLPIRFLSSGVGLRLENDAIGAHRTTQAMVSYNYQLGVGEGILAIGTGIGYQQYVLDGGRIRTPQGSYTDPQFNHNDDFLPLGRITAGTPVFEFGLAYASDRLQVGLAAQPVFAPVLAERAPGRFRLQPQRHYVLQAGYQIDMGSNLLLEPGILAKTDGVSTQIEVVAIGHWKDKFTGGAGYRGFGSDNRDAVLILAGVAINDKTVLYYGYDLPISGLQSTNRGSHEIMLRYNLNRPLGEGKLPPVIYNPRYLD